MNTAIRARTERLNATMSPQCRDALASLPVKGFCVIREFLDPGLVEAIADDYRARGASANANYDISVASSTAIEALQARIERTASEFRELHGANVGFAGLHQAYYFAAKKLAFNAWHQDAESHYLLGTHRDYLNFYIPVIKPERGRTNLQVIPADALREQAPEAWPLIEHAGGTLCYEHNGQTLVIDESGERIRLPFDIDALAVTPDLGPGDLLLMRGDTFHRTQDADTDRVAISLRLTNPDLRIRLSDLARGSSKKLGLMAGNWAEFGPVFDYLAATPEGEASWADVRVHKSSLVASNPAVDRWKGRRRILREKLRHGLVLDSLRREFSFRRARRHTSSSS